MSNCWDLKGCPASHYIDCTAYKRRINCWEIRQGCLCHAYEDCKYCPVFMKFEKEKREQEASKI